MTEVHYHVSVQLRLPWSAPVRRASARRELAIDGRVFPIVIARHRWARRYVLRVTADGQLRVTVPRGASIAGGLAFAEREAAWIAREWATVQARTTWGDGTRVWYRGVLLTLSVEDVAVRVGETRVTCGPRQDVRAVLQAHWRAAATRELPSRCLALASEHGLSPASVRVRDQQSRWGACSGKGAITLNWRLVQMPPDVADYVMLHELAHLRQPNHSRRFWREVDRLCPSWRDAERWLRAHGRELL
ncbi:MAG TPA: SprT family zinc-dependent metalloprotease [Vicinamibacterales bacterium]|jgi:predicted metal-dependent hydrolase|nr:SprT family zinc-dependent metalloprotease [Vicinamibacterales bacterium]